MEKSRSPRFSRFGPVVLACAAFWPVMLGKASAEPVPVHHPEGTVHGFLSLSTAGGRVLAAGDLLQVVDGDRVTSHLVFHFKDGSIDDEITIFSQKDNFRLISYHRVQKGPFFPTAIDMVIDAASGRVTVRSQKKNGKEELKSEDMNLPEDLSNGLVTAIAKNLDPGVSQTKMPMIVATPAPRLITLTFSPSGTHAYSLAGERRKALGYRIKVELGGLAGALAPLLGKAPPDVHMWVIGGEVPTFIREEGPIYAQGPILTIQLASPVWPGSPPSKPRKH
ncbi:MAG TPA: hypothetical protein VKR52_09895 [Terracidiphilus sp.]|nr:hypothetical protein [Terracidiphilus sp.]